MGSGYLKEILEIEIEAPLIWKIYFKIDVSDVLLIWVVDEY